MLGCGSRMCGAANFERTICTIICSVGGLLCVIGPESNLYALSTYRHVVVARADIFLMYQSVMFLHIR